MLLALESYVHRGHRIARTILLRQELKLPLRVIAWFFAGFCLSAASLGHHMQPIAPALLCAGISGWMPLPYALGASLGYGLFWGNAGAQGIAWMAAGLPVCALLNRGKFAVSVRLLQPAIAGLLVAVWGVIFQSWRGDTTPIVIYTLRVCIAFGATWIFTQVRRKRDPAAEWVAAGLCVLALAQIAPLPILGLGFVTGSMMVARMAFPAVALAGLALDLAQVTPVPMTAVLCLSYMLRLIPGIRKGILAAAPAVLYCVVMALCGYWDLYPLAALLIGGVAGVMLPQSSGRIQHHRGETGFAQVRLELAADVMAQSERLLLEVAEHPIDEAVLIQKAAERACGSCPCRKTCKEMETVRALPTAMLHQTLSHVDDLPVFCKKRSRLLPELRRSQDQYRMLKADRERQNEYRGAIIQQYRFLSEYLQDLSDKISQREQTARPRYQPEVAVCSAGKEKANGDRCLWFAGTECRYYLLLCDGMGTGVEAAREADAGADMLRRLLMAGYPAPYALRSLNSLCALRDRGAAVTVDLAEFSLDSGKVTVYKWGAAPSWLLLPSGVEQIGQSSVPPGFSVRESRETVERLVMRRGEALVMLSDGVEAAGVLGAVPLHFQEPAGTLAAKILEASQSSDDATVAVIRLEAI